MSLFFFTTIVLKRVTNPLASYHQHTYTCIFSLKTFMVFSFFIPFNFFLLFLLFPLSLTTTNYSLICRLHQKIASANCIVLHAMGIFRCFGKYASSKNKVNLERADDTRPTIIFTFINTFTNLGT